MAIFPYFSKTLYGVRLQNTGAQLIVHHHSESGVLLGGTVWVGTYYVTLTGRYKLGSGSYADYEISEIPRSSISIDTNDPTREWRQISTEATGNAYSIINEIIANNKTILENNLFAARFANRLTNEEKKLVQELQTRLQVRNDALKDSDFIQSAETSSPPGYMLYSGELNQLMAANIGSVTVTIIVAVVLVAALSGAAYWAYKYYYDESKQDVKFSKDLTKTLKDRLTTEEWAQLEKETAGMITKAKITTKLSSIGNVGTFLIIAAIGFVALPLLSKAQEKLNS